MIKKNIFVLTFLMLFSLAPLVDSASFFYSPASGTHTVGQTYSVGVYLNSAGTAVNAVQGVISFPANTIQIVSISKASSIVNLWVQEPSYSNGNGTISFEGVILNPGYQGQNGKIITITFRPKLAGEGKLIFTSGQALANDGNGTNVMKEMKSASFTLATPVQIEEPKEEEEVSPKPVVIVPIEVLEAPRISYISKHVDSGEPLVLHGQTYPNSTVSVQVKGEDGSETVAIVRSNLDGKFIYIHSTVLSDGIYSVTAAVVDEKNNTSLASNTEVIEVRPTPMVTITKTVTNYLTLAITVAALLLLFGFILGYAWKKIQQFRKLIYKETKQADATVLKRFGILEENVAHIEFLENEAQKKGMSTEEKYVFKQLKENVAAARRAIQKELKDIDDLVN